MQHTWDEFRKAYENEQVARLNFCDLCEDLMRLKYPDHNIIKSVDILENDTKKVDNQGKNSVIYLPKFFTDGISNSRKGQIRKSLNDNLPFMKANDIKNGCLSYLLNYRPKNPLGGKIGLRVLPKKTD